MYVRVDAFGFGFVYVYRGILCVHAVMTYLQINYECNINSGYKYTSKPISHTSSSLHLRHVPIEITNAIN